MVGVAQPVVVTFSKPVTDRAAAVQTVHITSSRCVTEHFDGSNDATLPPAHDEYDRFEYAGLPVNYGIFVNMLYSNKSHHPLKEGRPSRVK